MKKKYITWKKIETMTKSLITQMDKDKWQPEAVWGLLRGGLTPAILISQHYNIPMYSWHNTLRDNVHYEFQPNWEDDWSNKHCLIVDDINDSGATILSCQEQTAKYSQVKYAVLQHKETSPAKIDYYAQYIDKSKCNEWIVYPWEEWSK